MNEKFFDLKKEKQDRMINASLKALAGICMQVQMILSEMRESVRGYCSITLAANLVYILFYMITV